MLYLLLNALEAVPCSGGQKIPQLVAIITLWLLLQVDTPCNYGHINEIQNFPIIFNARSYWHEFFVFVFLLIVNYQCFENLNKLRGLEIIGNLNFRDEGLLNRLEKHIIIYVLQIRPQKIQDLALRLHLHIFMSVMRCANCNFANVFTNSWRRMVE